jgi:uncharacterized protein with NRDE domain
MCLILFALRAHPAYPLIVAANRDEAYARPAAPAEFWADHPHIFGGRDLEQGGTWLGLSSTGRFAAITNYRQGHRVATAKRSRGELTRDFLIGSPQKPSYLRAVEHRSHEYNGFSLIAGSPEALGFYSNRGGAVQEISSGVHGLSNHLLDEPWPKVLRGIAALTALLGSDEAHLVSALFGLLADRGPAPDQLLPETGIALERERALSASFIAGETYGTRASTIVLIGTGRDVLFCEYRFGPRGAPTGKTEQRFPLDAPIARMVSRA